ncbi:hypothetical protein GCM10022388_17690 [Flavobacterium chungnamense]|uniref:Uncharacterized protein n=1 Tax=Flavobacterium chungnamense TaxID=706182 RepID=A0ABP7UVE1_9FLAO
MEKPESTPKPSANHLSDGPVKTKVTLEVVLFKVKFAVMFEVKLITPVDFDCEKPLKQARANNKKVIFFIVIYFSKFIISL